MEGMDMSNVAVNVAIMKDEKILLTQREDFETWVLPSGRVEEGESLAQAAIREAKEETGLDIELTHLVGVYSRRGTMYPGYTALFAARRVGGAPKLQPGETIAVEWFPFDKIPTPLSVGQARRIRDAIDGAAGLVVLQEIRSSKLPDQISKEELYALRDRSGLPRQAFYLQMFGDAEIEEVVEVCSK
jgi:ADP-ribose pyrophosphatase YjhB (NUDIX family)